MNNTEVDVVVSKENDQSVEELVEEIFDEQESFSVKKSGSKKANNDSRSHLRSCCLIFCMRSKVRKKREMNPNKIYPISKIKSSTKPQANINSDESGSENTSEVPGLSVIPEESQEESVLNQSELKGLIRT